MQRNSFTPKGVTPHRDQPLEVTDYISHQQEHHREMSFESELKTLLEKHGVDHDPKYSI